MLAALAGYDGSHRAQVALKAHHQRPHRTVRRPRRWPPPGSAYGAGPLRRYAADLVVPRRVRAQCALLKGIALRYVMRRPRLAERATSGSARCCAELVAALAGAGAGRRSTRSSRRCGGPPADDAARLRVVIDQVASLTDPAAVAWHARLVAGNGTPAD